MASLLLLVCCALLDASSAGPPTTQKPPPAPESAFEAAFQGECREDSPCQHLCFDLHDGTFECACRDGFTLTANGYSCTENSSQNNRSGDSSNSTISGNGDGSSNSHLVGSPIGSKNRDGSTSGPTRPRRILPLPQPLVDNNGNDVLPEYDPADDSAKWKKSNRRVQQDHDVRWKGGRNTQSSDTDWSSPVKEHEWTVSGQSSGQSPDDGDWYKGLDEDPGFKERERSKGHKRYKGTGHDSKWSEGEGGSGSEWYDRYQPVGGHWQRVEEDQDGSPESQPLVDSYQLPMNTVTMTTPPSRPLFRACHDVACESGGVCVLDEETELARCRCPLGRRGFFCEYPTEVRYPRFRGTSYLTLPILRDAHKSMQITLEFRPERHDGILLYSGERLNLQGDFIAVTLNRGFVEFRFDCGMGEGVVRSDQPVLLNSWNSLTVYRDRWDAWMQLNGGKQTQGRSKGLFSRITFHLSLFMGGSPNTTIIADRLQMDQGFKGCVRLLEINKRLYDFRSGSRGDASDGLDIEECSADVCNRMSCLNGGRCVASSPDQGVCLCSLGFTGDLCQTAVEVVVPSFNGSSYLQYSGLGSRMLSFMEVQVTFRPRRPSGVFFYNGYRMDGTGDFFSIAMSSGHVEVRFDLGTGPAIIRSVEPVELNEWHTVFVSRTARVGVLEVDKQPRVEGMAPGAFTQLSLPLNLYVGGIPDLQDVARKADIKASFAGCIQKVVINNRPLKLLGDALSGINVANCEHPCVHSPCQNGGSCEPRMDFYVCHCLLGYAGTNCENEVMEMIAEPMFNGFSHLQFVDEEIMKRIRGDKTDIRFRFRSFTSDGLILWAGQRFMSSTSDYLSLGVREGYLRFAYNLGSGEVVIALNGTRVDDGRWHIVHAIRFEREGSLNVDNSPVAAGVSPGGLSQLNVNSGLFLGGLRDLGHETMNKYHFGLVGCMANFTLSTDFHVRLVTQAATGVNIQPCV